MANIKIMKEVLANKIAAGEVIERPLSVVKELVENSLDANSSKIKINLVDSGIKKITITDNGSGMSEHDIPLAIKRHATSKLYDDKDLFKISTLGFRGEALPSIFAVSQMTISSSTDGIGGNKLIKLDDENFKLEPIAMNKGTIIEIDNLFYNTPVRYKHLSNPFYELSIIVSYLNKLALIHPHVSFEVLNNDNSLLKTSGNGDVRAILAKQYNLQIAKKMMVITAKNEHFDVELYTSHPHDTRSRKSHITIGLNSRLIRNYEIENKIIESYGTFLHTGQYPISFINIKVNYSLIDVNIHPTKQQVKISLIDNLLELIEVNIKKQLQSLIYMAEPTNIQVRDYQQEVKTQNEQFENEVEELFSNVKYEREQDVVITENDKVVEEQSSVNDFERESANDIFTINSTNVNHSEGLFTLESDDKPILESRKLPIFEFVGTLHNTYILCQNGEGLFLIDQHAAQERINYELIVERFRNHQFNFQQTLVPIIINLNETESQIFKQNIDLTENFGFKTCEFGINSFRVVEVDTWILKRKNAEADINEMVNAIIDKKQLSFDQYYDEVAISMACKKSIKAHQRMNQSEAEHLLQQLNQTNSPYTCPHGRPVIVKITTAEIEKMFKRVF